MEKTVSQNQVRFSEVCSRLSDQAPEHLASYSGESIFLVTSGLPWMLPIRIARHIYSLLIGGYTHILYS
jgi:hypothetical protein